MAEPPLTQSQLRGLCYVLGDTAHGLSGSEIGRLLAECQIDDVAAGMAKHDRLYGALSERQALDMSSSNVLAFVQEALSPVRYTHRIEFYEELRRGANRVLSFAGFFVQEDGKIRRMSPSKTIPEAVEKAGALLSELSRRNIHPAVQRSCRTEVLQEDYAGAVFEAAKGMADALRAKAHSGKDGWELVDYSLGVGRKDRPRLAFNNLESETDWAQHQGFQSLLKGVFSMFRNPPAHTPKIRQIISEADALDALTLISLLSRRIDELVPTGDAKPPS